LLDHIEEMSPTVYTPGGRARVRTIQSHLPEAARPVHLLPVA
jgi:hypothetical protein